MAFDLARDGEGVKLALLDLFEESLAWTRLQSSLEAVDDDGRERLTRSLPHRAQSPGYYKLGEYLLWLHQRVSILGLPIEREIDRERRGLHSGIRIAAFEADGLCLLSQARAEFERRHPTCGRCG